MSTHEIPGRGINAIFWSQWAYWVTLLMAVLSLVYLPPGPSRTLVVLTPVVTAIYSVSLIYWLYRDCDEYIRLRILKCVAVTAIFIVFLTLGYFILELCGFPRISMVVVNLVGWTVFNLQLMYVLIASR